MKKTIYLSILLVLSFVLSACSSSDESYASLLFVNNKTYYGQEKVKVDDYTINKIGEIKTKVDIENKPTEEFSSNSLEVGTEIFSVEDENFLLVKNSNGEYQKFTY